VNDNLPTLRELAHDANPARVADSRLRPLQARQAVDGAFTGGLVLTASTVQRSDGGKARGVGEEVSCGGALCDGVRAHVEAAGWAWRFA
jgi:hypothetical protein